MCVTICLQNITHNVLAYENVSKYIAGKKILKNKSSLECSSACLKHSLLKTTNTYWHCKLFDTQM